MARGRQTASASCIGHSKMSAGGLLPAARTRALRDALEQFSQGIQDASKRLRVVYSTRPDWDALSGERHYAVLDASFNPPTRAHLALASMPRSATDSKALYDAHILIFSVRNADKGRGRPGDASPLQRLEMIELLAKQLEKDLPKPNVAVALVDEPLVFAKSTLIHETLAKDAPLHLHYLMGSDTITRVFQPKYYASEAHLASSCTKFFEEEQSVMVCAERSAESVTGHAGHPDWSGDEARSDELRTLLASAGPAHDWYKRGAIQLRHLDPDAARHSSTAVRQFLQEVPTGDAARTALCQMVPDTLVDYLLAHNTYKKSE